VIPGPHTDSEAGPGRIVVAVELGSLPLDKMETTGVARSDVEPEMTAKALLAESSSVVVLTGAGISTDSGIPDFRGPAGVWTTNPDARAKMTLEAYVSDPEQRRRAWASRGEGPVWKARPNAGHQALLELEAREKLALLVTQNTDGLHRAAGHADDRVVELHGSVHQTICLSCANVLPTAEVLARVRLGEADPRCREVVADAECGGLLKVATVSFGQRLNAADLKRAVRAVQSSDMLLVVGSSLQVEPAAGLVPLAVDVGAAVAIVNATPTRHDEIADVVVRGSISEVLPRLVS
jgi:NAD-dependent deacetylase